MKALELIIVILLLHYINNEWELKCFLLETGEIVEQHTVINLANYIKEALIHWNLPATQISAVATDNASNITAAKPNWNNNILVTLVTCALFN